MWLCAITFLAQGRLAAALWNVKLLATAKCWPPSVFENIALVAGGKIIFSGPGIANVKNLVLQLTLGAWISYLLFSHGLSLGTSK